MKKSGSRWKSKPLAVVVLVTALGVAPAQAAEQDDVHLSEEAVTAAMYQGRIIDLANNWEGARACLV